MVDVLLVKHQTRGEWKGLTGLVSRYASHCLFRKVNDAPHPLVRYNEEELMGKNLILLHLDDISQLCFWQYHTRFPEIWRLKEKSMYFSNCYVEGGSTIFGVHSLHFGSVAALDVMEKYDKSFFLGSEESFVKYLKESGYKTAFYSILDRKTPLLDEEISRQMPE